MSLLSTARSKSSLLLPWTLYNHRRPAQGVHGLCLLACRADSPVLQAGSCPTATSYSALCTAPLHSPPSQTKIRVCMARIFVCDMLVLISRHAQCIRCSSCTEACRKSRVKLMYGICNAATLLKTPDRNPGESWTACLCSCYFTTDTRYHHDHCYLFFYWSAMLLFCP